MTFILARVCVKCVMNDTDDNTMIYCVLFLSQLMWKQTTEPRWAWQPRCLCLKWVHVIPSTETGSLLLFYFLRCVPCVPLLKMIRPCLFPAAPSHVMSRTVTLNNLRFAERLLTTNNLRRTHVTRILHSVSLQTEIHLIIKHVMSCRRSKAAFIDWR